MNFAGHEGGASISIRCVAGTELVGVADPADGGEGEGVEGAEHEVAGHAVDAVAVELVEAGEEVVG